MIAIGLASSARCRSIAQYSIRLTVHSTNSYLYNFTKGEGLPRATKGLVPQGPG